VGREGRGSRGGGDREREERKEGREESGAPRLKLVPPASLGLATALLRPRSLPPMLTVNPHRDDELDMTTMFSFALTQWQTLIFPLMDTVKYSQCSDLSYSRRIFYAYGGHDRK
jgi:hypothetical protein